MGQQVMVCIRPGAASYRFFAAADWLASLMAVREGCSSGRSPDGGAALLGMRQRRLHRLDPDPPDMAEHVRGGVGGLVPPLETIRLAFPASYPAAVPPPGLSRGAGLSVLT